MSIGNGQDFLNLVMNKSKIQSQIKNLKNISNQTSLSKGTTSNSGEITIDIDTYQKALGHSVELHKLILQQILLNHQISSKQKEQAKAKALQKENLLHASSMHVNKSNENNRYQTLYLMDKTGNDVIKYICVDQNKNDNIKQIENQKACNCSRRPLRSHKRSQSDCPINGTRNNSTMASNGQPFSKKNKNCISLLKSGFNKDASLEELEKMSDEINELIKIKMQKINLSKEGDTLCSNNNKQSPRKLKQSSNIYSTRKRNINQNNDEDNSFLRDLSTRNNNTLLLSGNKKLNINDNNPLLKSASAKLMFDENEAVNRRLQKSGLTKEYLSDAIQRLRALKEDNSRNKSLFDNELFSLDEFKKQRSSSVIKSKINFNKPLFEHVKYNPKPNGNSRNNELSVKDKFVTDKYLDKMKYSGVISQDAINKIRNLKYRQKDEKYYTNVFKKNMNNV